MRGFVWKRLDYVTDNYHHSGGILCLARNIGEARARVCAHREKVASDPDSLYSRTEELADSTLPAPDYTFDAGSSPELLIVFPDAGCC